jgi:type VI protein secretion system component VasK
MRQLIESLSPDAGRIHWKWIGGVFAFYVAAMVVAANVLMTHQSAKHLAQETAGAATAHDRQRSADAAASPRSRMAIDH